MTELEKIAYAKSFIDKLALGVNPLDDSSIPENDITNNVRISRCLFYVSDILRQVIENGGLQPQKTKSNRKKKEFAITNEELAQIAISDMPLSVSEIAERLNECIDTETTKKISASLINNWLVKLDILKIVEPSSGKTYKVPTDKGKDLGILAEERASEYGTYFALFFNSDAQLFIYDNVYSIIEYNRISKAHAENQGQVWTTEQDDILSSMFKKGIPISQISKELKRTRGGIAARLKRLGLIKDKREIE